MISAAEEATFTLQRTRMVEQQLRARGIGDERVLSAMLRVPRHEFVPEQSRTLAYEDHPLPIGEEQTISQPYIVAIMLETLEISANDKVLEIGTGSGYVTALLAELAAQVFSVERHTSLATKAAEVINRLGYKNVQIVVGDGSQGLPPYAPYDVILVSAAATELPSVLLSQLREGGCMIIPIGSADSQQLQFIRMQNGEAQVSLRDMCRFVPLVSSVNE
jgi:protein-L-isoaspartate(D-aspartate) O-methyltransferase